MKKKVKKRTRFDDLYDLVMNENGNKLSLEKEEVYSVPLQLKPIKKHLSYVLSSSKQFKCTYSNPTDGIYLNPKITDNKTNVVSARVNLSIFLKSLEKVTYAVKA